MAPTRTLVVLPGGGSLELLGCARAPAAGEQLGRDHLRRLRGQARHHAVHGVKKIKLPAREVAKEIGHALGLANHAGCTALMTSHRCSHYAPSPDQREVALVNRLYARQHP